MSLIVLSVAGIFLLLSAAVGLAASWQRQNISEDYFLAGRALPWYAVAGSICGASLRLEVWLSMVALAWASGLAAGWLAWGNLLAMVVLGWVCLPYFYRKKLWGVAEFLERRYSPGTRGLFVLLMLPALVLGVLAPALCVGGQVLCDAGLGHHAADCPWTFAACVAVVAAVTAVWCVYGGVMAGVWASAFGMLVFLAGGAVLAVAAIYQADGMGAVIEANPAPRLSLLLGSPDRVLPWTGVLGFILLVAPWQTALNPLVVQRCLAARSERDAKLGILVAGLVQLALATLIVLPGLAAFAAHPVPGDMLKQVGEWLDRKSLLGALGQGLVVSAVLAAVTSAVSGAASAVSSLWTMDLCQDLLGRNVSEAELIARGRRSALVTMVLGAALVPIPFFWTRGIFDFVFQVAAVVGPPVSVMFLLAFFWPRAHGRAALATLLVGVLAGLGLWLTTEFGQEVPAWLLSTLNRAGLCGIASLVVLVLGTFAIPPDPRELYDPDTHWSLAWARR